MSKSIIVRVGSGLGLLLVCAAMGAYHFLRSVSCIPNDEVRQFVRSSDAFGGLCDALMAISWDSRQDMTFEDVMHRLAAKQPNAKEFRGGYDELRKTLPEGRRYGHLQWIPPDMDPRLVPLIWDEGAYPGAGYMAVVFLNGARGGINADDRVSRERLRELIEDIRCRAPSGTAVAILEGETITAP